MMDFDGGGECFPVYPFQAAITILKNQENAQVLGRVSDLSVYESETYSKIVNNYSSYFEYEYQFRPVVEAFGTNKEEPMKILIDFKHPKMF
ncbi:hypothetical protein DPMN_140802 [Dreissena polymorpha]|uniref:Uncharacterized protein n=1 Tax=Dreissena polymorpha TaxID=45954 RepID=A0A9D4GE67_DREPO|nr:hypothetical protein DPMN_140802 [Dreissena polymorpha]